MVAVPEIDSLTQARGIAEAELIARELIAVTLDIPVEDVAVDLTFSEECAHEQRNGHPSRTAAVAFDIDGVLRIFGG